MLFILKLLKIIIKTKTIVKALINPFICVGLPIFSIGFNWFKLYGVRIVQQVIRYSDLFVICVYLAILYCLFLAALGSPAGKGLTSWLSFM